MALYVDMGLLPSIGEVTVKDGEAWRSAFDLSFNSSGKPGLYATTEFEEIEDEDGNTFNTVKSITIDGNEGWASKDDRNVWSLGFLEFDEWDQELLVNSKARIKRMFKQAYNDRQFMPNFMRP